MSAKPDSTSATLRAIAVLEIIVRADRPVSLTEVMTEVSLPKPTVFRILTLLDQRWLRLFEQLSPFISGRRANYGRCRVNGMDAPFLRRPPATKV